MLSNIVTADTELLWRAGKLRYKLHSDQREVYDKYRKWRADVELKRREGAVIAGKHPFLWVTDSSRRWGKDFLGLVVAHEDAIRRPESVITYGTAFLKDLGNIVIPLARQLIADCPHDKRPVYRANYRGTSEGIYFPNGSVIRFAGIDMNPDALRGQHSDGIFITEASFCDELEDMVENVLKPQLIGRYHATIMFNSTPPRSLAHPYVRDYMPDARDRGAYVLRTIDDAPQYTQAEKDLFTGGEEGRKTVRIRREYYCEYVAEENALVVPEFNKEKHVTEFEIPNYGHAYVTIDPGVKDLCAMNFCVWDFEHARLLVVDEWTKRNANTNELVDALKVKELTHWHSVAAPLKYWDGKHLLPNPYARISDVDTRMITDMSQLHGISVQPARKDDAEAALHALRNAFLGGRILIHPRCVNTIEHLEGALWNKPRTDFQRSERLGHCDHVDALKYCWRHVNKSANPFPPHAYRVLRAVGNSDKVFTKPEYMKTGYALSKALNTLFSGRRAQK